ncbi:MAG: ABC transporter substrate-binding protein [Dorea sp.]|nr:ABC transporter substrate-binding protein [Dorea sp.]
MKKNVYQLICVILCLTMITACILTGCKTKEDSSSGQTTQDEKSSEEVSEQEEEVPVVQGLEYERTMELDYAESFDVYYYREGYKLIDVHNDRRYLIVPEGSDAPEDLDSDIIVLEQPLDCIYLAATSAMALFDAIDSIGAIRMSGTQASGWYIEHAVEAMESGEMIYAGKYSEPDYELLINEGCDLAVESTMILHTPKVQEMIEDLDIPVFIDRSSYETHPLGRTEWVKLYAAMMNCEETAEAFFAEQTQVIEELKDFKNTEKTVAFFYVSTDGTVVVRKSEDYIPKMIEIAGGRYAFEDLKNEESDSAAVNLSMEEFYAVAQDADYLIYNSSIDHPIESVEDLIAKDELFREFKAVKEGNVWCTGKYLYQATDIVGNLITDIHLMLTDGEESQMTFLYHVN